MKEIIVVDVETTGLDPQVHDLVEYAAVSVSVENRCIKPHGYASFLVNPGHPIPPEASAVHHLTDRDVANAIPADELRAMLRRDVTYAAHNAKFDAGFLRLPIAICTKKLAYRIWPTAPRHSNQVLRYWIGIEFNDASQRAVELPPHRALHDAFVTAHLLLHLLAAIDWDIDRAIKISSEPALLPKVTFGKHAELTWANVPKDYLQWVIKQDFDEDVKFTAKHYLNR